MLTILNVFIYPPNRLFPLDKSIISSYINSHTDKKIVTYSDQSWRYYYIMPNLPDNTQLYVAKRMDDIYNVITPSSEDIVILPKGKFLGDNLAGRIKDKFDNSGFTVYVIGPEVPSR